jgi:hypothetical protein
MPAKKSFQDIVTKPKKPAPMKPMAASEPKGMPEAKKIAREKTEEVSKIFRKTNYPAFTPSPSDGGGRYAIWGLAAISVFFLVFALSSLFSGAVVTITPKSEAFTLESAAFKAELDNPDADLPFQIMALTDSSTKTIKSTSSETVDKKATGRVVIYNNYSKLSQQLVVNTRLEDPSGKIYRIDNAVTVPGQTVSNGETVPGAVEVSVHADQTGEEYNIGLSDFTIPGLKGSPKYDKFYARSKTEIGGAIAGLVYVADQKEVEKIRGDLTLSLKDKLLQKASAELPKGFTILKDALFFEVTNSEATFESKTPDVPITVEGKLSALILDEKKLTEKIARMEIKDFNPEQSIYIPQIGKLNFALNTDPAALSSAQEVNFTVSGQGLIIWFVDEKKLASDLEGLSKSSLKDVLANYPNITRAEAKVSPFWRSKFPKNDTDIKIINTLASK